MPRPFPVSLVAIAKTVNAIQRHLVTNTRLKIPAIFHNEALNGVVAPHYTNFPTAIGLAATWDPQAVEEMADLMRRQMRSVGLLQALSPVMDVARDARWGRVHETYGEDPYLVHNPYVAEDPITLESLATEGKSLSERLAAESVTLLKNEKGLLPLGRNVKNIAIIGPHADSAVVGFAAYTYPAALQLLGAMFGGGESSMAGVGDSGDSAWLPAEAKVAMKNELQDYLKVDLGDYVKRSYAAVSLAEAVRRLLPDAKVTAVAGTGVVPSEPADIPAARAAAKEADAVILYVGGRAAWAGKDRTEGEGQDTANIDLPPQQVDLINAVTAVGKPTVGVVAMGRPQGLAAVIDRLPAVLTAYYGGPRQGPAIADAIFGVTNPSGKLPYTLPRHVGQVPIHHAQKTGSGYRRTKADIHKGYLDMPSTPLFPFGHGLSYTTFEYSPLKLVSDTVDVGGDARVSLTITNTGKRRGTEIVQLYAADTATGITLPAQQLVGFAGVDLEPGATKTVTFVVPLSVLAYTGVSGNLIMEPGRSN